MKAFASSASKGILAGLIGGFVASAVKSGVERFLQVRKIDEKSAQLKMIDKFSIQMTGSPIGQQNQAIVEQLVNLPLGATVGAFYGYQNRKNSKANIVNGVVLGGTTWLSTHETSLPLLGLERKPIDVPVKTQMHELLAHLVFGVTTEVVRSYVAENLRNHD